MTIAAQAGGPLSDELQVAVAPEKTYQRLLADEPPSGGRSLLRRLALVLLVIATLVPIMAVRRVTLGLIATAAVSWGFVVSIQIAIGAGVIRTAPKRRAGMLRALDLWFAGHLPYNLWVLFGFAWMASSASGLRGILAVSAIVPAAWAAVIVCAFCRVVLQETRDGARWRAAAHCVVVWTIALTYLAWSAGGWFQLLP
jgi:hypothetical protein